jgi:hypothetical protein
MKMKSAVTIATVLLGLSGVPGQANSQLALQVKQDLKRYGFTEDVSRLSSSQLSNIHLIIHSRRSESSKRGLIKSALGGKNSLRGILRGG